MPDRAISGDMFVVTSPLTAFSGDSVAWELSMSRQSWLELVKWNHLFCGHQFFSDLMLWNFYFYFFNFMIINFFFLNNTCDQVNLVKDWWYFLPSKKKIPQVKMNLKSEYQDFLIKYQKNFMCTNLYVSYKFWNLYLK